MVKSWSIKSELAETLKVKNDLYKYYTYGTCPDLEINFIEILFSNRGYGDRIILKDKNSTQEIIRDVALTYINNGDKIVLEGLFSEAIEFESIFCYGISLFFELDNIGKPSRSLLFSENGNISFLRYDGTAIKNIHFKNPDFSIVENYTESVYSYELNNLKNQVDSLKKNTEEILAVNSQLKEDNQKLKSLLNHFQSLNTSEPSELGSIEDQYQLLSNGWGNSFYYNKF